MQNPPKRFCRFLKGSKCVQSLKKRIKNSTEPFEGSAFYSTAELSLTEPFLRFCTAKTGFVRKYETLKVLCKTIAVQYGTIRVTYQQLMVLYRTSRFRIFSRNLFLLALVHFVARHFAAIISSHDDFVAEHFVAFCSSHTNFFRSVAHYLFGFSLNYAIFHSTKCN